MTQIIEGTWDEIKTHEAEFAGRHLTVIVDNNLAVAKPTTAEKWSEAWRNWTDGHDQNSPLLAEEAISRDSFYDGRA